MAKSSSSSWSWKSWTITTTRNSDGSVTYSANGNSVTVNNNWSYSYSSASWKTWGWTVKWWSNAASTFNSTYWGWSSITSNGNWWFTVNNSSSWSWWWSNNNPWFTPVNQVDFGGLQFWQGTSDSDQGSRNDMLGRYYAGRENATADTIRNDLMQNAWFASASAADQQNTINRIMNLQNQYRNGWGGWVWNELNELGDKMQTPYPQQQFQNDYSWQFANITNYINSLSWDLSWMRDLMEKNNSMFLSKLDAQMTQQKAMEEKFNAEWSRIEGQMDENTKAQKTRLDQMEQKYNENLQKMQDMLTDYYTWTMDALEAKAAWESAAAASDLSAKGLNSAVVANTTAGLDKNYREQFNALMKNNIELWQQLNNDYQEFMVNLVNQHNTLDQNQIRTLTEGLQMKQAYRQQETDLVNSYIDNVYKPMEDHISKLAGTYTEKADAAYGKERAVAEYKWMSTDWRTKAIMDRLIAMVWDGNLEMLSEQDLNLVKQIASRTDIWSTEEAIAVLLKAAQKSGDSDIINAVSTAQQNWTWNINPGKTNNPGNTNNPGWNDTEEEWNEGEDTETTEETSNPSWILEWLNYNFTSEKDIENEIKNIARSWNPLYSNEAVLSDIISKIKKDINTIKTEYNKETDQTRKDALLKMQNMYSKTLNRLGTNWDLRKEVYSRLGKDYGWEILRDDKWNYISQNLKQHYISDSVLDQEKKNVIKYIGKDKINKVNKLISNNQKELQNLVQYEKDYRDYITWNARINLVSQIQKRYEYDKWLKDQLANVQ